MIPVKNIFYMLTYAFQVLKEQGYKSIATEQFDSVTELCAAILSKGIAVQLKRGLNREYILETEAITALRGKINVSDSITKQTLLKQQMVCTFDEFSVNSYFNKIIKSTIGLLLRGDISKARKKELRNHLVFFDQVDFLDIHNINWDVHYSRNNQSYRMLISICYLVVNGLLQSAEAGSRKMMDFLDEQRMSRLYEKFILEYYKKEHSTITTNASQIQWQLDDDMNDMLPIMQTDVMLTKGKKTLIIDAKYYSRTTQFRFDSHAIHSANLYQIFTYVKNKKEEVSDQDHQVAGLLLYAKTRDSVLPNNTYSMSGSKISVRTLDLDCNFDQIRDQLDCIADEYFYEGV